MLSGEKILITGVSGMVALPIAAFLARENEVWGVSRFQASRADALATNPETRSQVETLGVTTRSADIAKGDFSMLPDDFTYVLHFAHTRRGAGEFVQAIQANGVGAGLLLRHCRKARAALVVSSMAVYSPHEDPFHRYTEEDDIGRAHAPWAPTSPVSKVSLEAVARFCAEAFSLPVTIMRLNTVYGPMGGLPVLNMDQVATGKTVSAFSDPYPHSPIHIEDMCEQIEPLLAAAGTPANIVNWGGDETVTLQEWCAYAGKLAGQKAHISVTPIPGVACGAVGDNTKRKAITGPSRVPFKDGFRRLFEARHLRRAL